MTVPADSREPDPGSALEDEGIPDLSDALPAKVITGDAQEDMPVPGDEPVAADDFGTTAAEMHEGEPLSDRLAREVPDRPLPGDGGDEPFPADRDERIGRFVDVRDDDTNHQQDVYAVDAGADRGGYSPEERAMHEDR